MASFPKTLGLLDGVIHKLEANTGGEPVLPEEQTQPEKVEKKEEAPKPKQEKPKQEGNEKKEKPKEEAKKEKGAPKKPQGKNQGDKVKLPEGADPDIVHFMKVDIRVSEIVECWKHPESENLYCEKILVGDELREIASGLQKYVPLENMKGKVIVMANLKPRPLAGFKSNGMVVCASKKEENQVEIIVPDGARGERVYLDGFQELFDTGAELQPVINQKTLDKCVEYFRTDEEGIVTWKGIKVRTKEGFLRSNLKTANVS